MMYNSELFLFISVVGHKNLQSATFELEDSEESFNAFHGMISEHFPTSSSKSDSSCNPSKQGHYISNSATSSTIDQENQTSESQTITSSSQCERTEDTMYPKQVKSAGKEEEILSDCKDTGTIPPCKDIGVAMASSKQIVSSPSICMVGLHCCADLTPSMLHLFKQSPLIRCLLCFGCCYHNMRKIKHEGIYHQ